jgi:DNA/RNA-binding domain of Phe-tRNA-synthetase-like protein
VNKMEYRIADAIFVAFPNFRRGVVVGKNINNHGVHLELAELLAAEAAVVNADPLKLDDPRLAAWDSTYQSFGANPRRDTPSIRFLITQISKGRPPRPINDVVNIFNIMSLRYRIPCGGDDIGALNGENVKLDFAKGNESFAALFSPEKVETPPQGEVLYFTSPSNRVMCRRWNWRNADFSRIRPETTNVAVNLDGLIPPLTSAALDEAVAAAADLLTRFCGGKVTTYVLDRSNPIIEL